MRMGLWSHEATRAPHARHPLATPPFRPMGHRWVAVWKRSAAPLPPARAPPFASLVFTSIARSLLPAFPSVTCSVAAFPFPRQHPLPLLETLRVESVGSGCKAGAAYPPSLVPDTQRLPSRLSRPYLSLPSHHFPFPAAGNPSLSTSTSCLSAVASLRPSPLPPSLPPSLSIWVLARDNARRAAGSPACSA